MANRIDVLKGRPALARTGQFERQQSATYVALRNRRHRVQRQLGQVMQEPADRGPVVPAELGNERVDLLVRRIDDLFPRASTGR